MDVLYHAAVGLILSKATTDTFLPQAALYAVLPDLLGTTIHMAYKVKLCADEGNFWKNLKKEMRSNTFYTKMDKVFYRSTHSLFFWLLITLLTREIFPDMWQLLSLSYLSHILIDIPTHEGEFSQRILFPLSDWHFIGKSWAGNRKMYRLYWFALASISGLQVILNKIH